MPKFGGCVSVRISSSPRRVGCWIICGKGRCCSTSSVLLNNTVLSKGRVERPDAHSIQSHSPCSGGAAAARIAVINALAILQQELGSLAQVKQVVRLTGHVASAEGFVEQPAVVNGASDLLVDVFGEAGRHARLALGAFELPLQASLELELIVQRFPS